jgi:hypothetical protein
MRHPENRRGDIFSKFVVSKYMFLVVKGRGGFFTGWNSALLFQPEVGKLQTII